MKRKAEAPHVPASPDVLTVDDLMNRPGWPLSRNGTYSGIKSGDIPSIRIGKKILIPRVALETLLRGERPQTKTAS